jgi:four helix bundle protein
VGIRDWIPLTARRLPDKHSVPSISSYRDLQVWHASMDLVDICFDLVEALPSSHRFIFCNQILRAAISIPSNIAEGSRRPRRAYLNHLSICLGSHGGLETLMEILRRRNLAPHAMLSRIGTLGDSVGRMLHGLVRSLEA